MRCQVLRPLPGRGGSHYGVEVAATRLPCNDMGCDMRVPPRPFARGCAESFAVPKRTLEPAAGRLDAEVAAAPSGACECFAPVIVL